MSLSTVSETAASSIPSNWDWKGMNVEKLRNYANMDIFSEASITPDTTLILAGPPRLGPEGGDYRLSPLGLVTNMSFNSDNQLQPQWELGSDQTYFTRGKAVHAVQIGAMVANKPSLMKLLTKVSPTATTDYPTDNNGQFWMALDTETCSAPFGLLLLFKSKGSHNNMDNGSGIGSAYLENCNISNFSFNLSSQDLVLQENISIMFDRMIPTAAYGG